MSLKHFYQASNWWSADGNTGGLCGVGGRRTDDLLWVADELRKDRKFSHVAADQWEKYLNPDLYDRKENSLGGLAFHGAFINDYRAWKTCRVFLTCITAIVFGCSCIKCGRITNYRNQKQVFNSRLLFSPISVCVACQRSMSSVFKHQKIGDRLRCFVDFDSDWSESASLAALLDPQLVKDELSSGESRRLYDELHRMKSSSRPRADRFLELKRKYRRDESRA